MPARLAGDGLAASAEPGRGGVVVFRRAGGRRVPDLAAAAALSAPPRRVPRLVLLSAAAPRSEPSQPRLRRPETYRPEGSNPIARAWRELEALAAAKLPEAERIVLRPAPVATRDGGDFIARRLVGAVRRGATGVRPVPSTPGARRSRRGGAAAPSSAAPAGPGSTTSRRGAPCPCAAPCAWPACGASPWAGRAPAASSTTCATTGPSPARKIERELGFVPRTTSAEAVLAAFGRSGSGRPSRSPTTSASTSATSPPTSAPSSASCTTSTGGSRCRGSRTCRGRGGRC